MFENSQSAETDTQKVLFVCAGCGNSIREDPDSWCAAPGWETTQHASGCLTHVESDLRAMREGYLSSAAYADGYIASLNYRKDAERVQAIADLIAALNTSLGASPSPGLAAQADNALGEFLDALADGLDRATDSYSKASFSSDIARVQALRNLITPITAPA